MAHALRIRWLKRARPPVLFALIGFALLAVPHTGLAPDWDKLGKWPAVVASIFFIAAIGWGIGTLVDGLVKRRLARLNFNEPDNLEARKSATRLDVIRRIWTVAVGVITVAAALTAIPGVKQIGVSLFASAGIAGIAIGIAARPMLSNLIAGLQIAFTQPIRLDDAVVVEDEWGWIEEIGLFYVVIRIWDWRRLIVPLSYFIEQPFQNWTRKSASIIGSVFWSLDYRAPVADMRDKLAEICKSTPLWDGNIVNLQVSDTGTNTIQVRALATAKNSPDAWDLRCLIREKMIVWLQEQHPEALPRFRGEFEAAPQGGFGNQGIQAGRME
ncbi:MAG: mechanosensitive ion channel protein MscS [Hyphomonadaceae bacterium BRH_c29]|nr:MAG: mechanosensitive ion channel protein MscS [Hyphomonadaceae bacterium BRH_c29]